MEKIKKFIIENKRAILFFICIIIFLSILEDVFEYGILKSDIEVYKFINENFINDTNTNIFKFITNLGGAFVLIIIAILSLCLIRDKKLALTVPLNLVIITILNNVLKYIVQRERPNELRLVNETSYSFPSGHSMISMAFYGYFIYLIYKYVKNKYIKSALIALLSCLIVLIGFSRIYLGVHYTSDVLSGFVISIAYLILFTSIVKKIR